MKSETEKVDIDHNYSAQQNGRLTENRKRRSYLRQPDVPSVSLEQAVRVPRAIVEQYASSPITPIQLAQALEMSPSSGGFRMLCGAAIAYGLTSGGYNASEVKLEPLGKRVISPLSEGDDIMAMREAFLKPRVIHEFLRKYENHAVPRQEIAVNVIVEELGVPRDKAELVLDLILSGAEQLGLLADIKGKKYVHLNGSMGERCGGLDADIANKDESSEKDPDVGEGEISSGSKKWDKDLLHGESCLGQEKKRRVFVTHGKNKTFVEPIKKLLQFGELEPVVAIERQSVSQPVSDKVLGDMRSCGAAIIHVDAEQKLLDQEGKEQIVLNPNVLIEIGASMALYGRRFILLVKEGITLPSNLQGLYEVRYSGDALDGTATIKLLEAINAMKRQPSPNEPLESYGSGVGTH